MAQKPQAHPDVRKAAAAPVTRRERMAELETMGEALGEEYNRLQDEEDAELEAAEEAEQQPTAEAPGAGDADTAEPVAPEGGESAGDSDPPAESAGDPSAAGSAAEGTPV